MALQRVVVTKATIQCMLNTFYDMVHTCRTVFRESMDSYGGKIWAIPHSPPPQGLGQGNGVSPCIWALVSTPLPNALQGKGFGAAFKCCISKYSFGLVGYCFVGDSTIVQISPSPDTTTSEIVSMAQEEVDMSAGFKMAT